MSRNSRTIAPISDHVRHQQHVGFCTQAYCKNLNRSFQPCLPKVRMSHPIYQARTPEVVEPYTLRVQFSDNTEQILI